MSVIVFLSLATYVCFIYYKITYLNNFIILEKTWENMTEQNF